MKQTKTIEETICDVCGVSGAYRQCKCCGKDVCDNCHYELYFEKPRPKIEWENRPFLSFPSDVYYERHQYLDSLCKQCYESFTELIKTLKNPIEVIEMIKRLKNAPLNSSK